MRLALTGITSGVGVRLAEVALAAGHAVTGLVRNADRADARALGASGARLVRGDLDDKVALADLCAGAEVVLHLAAHVGDVGTPEQFHRVNVGGTRNALEAAAAAGALRFVQLSSVSVYGRPDRGRVTEEWPTRKAGLPYEDTKTEAERLAFGRGRELGLAVAAVRPPVIYGPHDRNFMPRALAALAARRFPLIRGGRAPFNVVWVDHVVDVLLLAAARADVAGEAFNVMDEVAERPPSVREVGEILAREAGLPPPRLAIPYPLAMVAGHAAQALHRLRKAEGAPIITPSVVKIMTREVIYDSSKAARVLGWAPRVGSREGLALAAREAAERHGAVRSGR